MNKFNDAKRSQDKKASEFTMPSIGRDIPSLVFSQGDNDDEEDAEEENKLMAILMKLKTAKSAIESNKKRKFNDGVLVQQQENYARFVKETVAAHNKAKTARIGKIRSSITQLQSKSKKMREKLNQQRTERVRNLKKHQLMVKESLSEFAALEMQLEASKRMHLDDQWPRRIQRAGQEVGDKLRQLEELTNRIGHASKEDRFSKMIQSIVGVF